MQIAALVAQGVVSPICEMIKTEDPRIVMVALEGIENILRSGNAAAGPGGHNAHAVVCEEAGVPEALEALEHAPANIYNKALSIIDAYFAGGEGEEGDEGEDGGPYDAGANALNPPVVADDIFQQQAMQQAMAMQAAQQQQGWGIAGPAAHLPAQQQVPPAFAFAPPAEAGAPPAPAWGGGQAPGVQPAFQFGGGFQFQ